MTILKEFNQVKQNIQIKKAELEAANRIDESKLEKLKAEYEQYVYQSDFTNAEKTKQAIKSVEGSMETRQDILGVLSDNRNAGIIEEGKRVVQKFNAEKSNLESKLEKQLQVAEKKKKEYLKELEKISEINKEYLQLTQDIQALRPLANWDTNEGVSIFGINVRALNSPTSRYLFNFYALGNEVKRQIEEVR